MLFSWVLIHSSFAAEIDAPSRAFLDKHCYECHDDTTDKGGVNLLDAPLSAADPKAFRQWVSAFDRAKSGEMPPEKKARPEPAELAAFLDALGKALTSEDRAHKQVVLRRLNRNEYGNTLRDLLGVTVRLEDRLPDDRVPRSFDTLGAALTISDSQVEQYHDIAREAVAAFLEQGEPAQRLEIRQPALKLVQPAMYEKFGLLLPVGEDGVVVFSTIKPHAEIRSVKFPAAGSYRIRIEARAWQSEEPVIMLLPTKAGPRYFEIPKEGRTIEVTDILFPGDRISPQPFGTIKNVLNATKTVGKPLAEYDGTGLYLGRVEIEGPLEERPSAPYRHLLAGIDPATAGLAEAKTVLDRFLPLAHRRPADESERRIAHSGMEALAKEGRGFDDLLRWGMAYALCSPHFLYLPEPRDAGGEQIDDHAFASRLSYFLWSSMPDEELRQLADSGKLRQPAVLRAEVERMLEDPRAAAFTRNFISQWARLDELDVTNPDEDIYPEYDAWLRASMEEETRRFFDAILRENRPVMDFVDSDWLMLDGRLAEHYGIEGVSGDAFQRVSLPAGHPRGGLMTQASVLKLTANGVNTSPVPRGLWVLETLLGVHLPPPPEAVPAVEPDISGAKSLREQLVAHRSAEACMACHVKIDPPGFALENFDPVGGWRTEFRPLSKRAQNKKPHPVDASGVTTDGIAFNGVNEFKAELMKRPDQIHKAVGESLLTYGTGRKMGFSDRPEIERLAAEGSAAGRGFRDLVHAIVGSEIFSQP